MSENANFSMDKASVPEKNDNCECVLHSNIEKLLSWAKQVRGMTTGLKEKSFIN